MNLPKPRWLILLLMLSLPLSALAGPLLGLFEPCPMQSQAQEPPASQEQAGHCEHQSKAPSKTLKLCKSGHECQSPSLLMLQASKAVQLVVNRPQRPHPTFDFRSSPSADVWRPPQA